MGRPEGQITRKKSERFKSREIFLKIFVIFDIFFQDFWDFFSRFFFRILLKFLGFLRLLVFFFRFLGFLGFFLRFLTFLLGFLKISLKNVTKIISSYFPLGQTNPCGVQILHLFTLALQSSSVVT